MTYKEETYVLDTLKNLDYKIKDETHENNIMLKEIIRAINYYVLNHNNENQNDFFMNVLANLVSNTINFKN